MIPAGSRRQARNASAEFRRRASVLAFRWTTLGWSSIRPFGCTQHVMPPGSNDDSCSRRRINGPTLRLLLRSTTSQLVCGQSSFRAPKQFGLSCLGRRLALRYSELVDGSLIVAMLDGSDMPSHPSGVIEAIEARCKALGAEVGNLAAVILDNYRARPAARSFVRFARGCLTFTSCCSRASMTRP